MTRANLLGAPLAMKPNRMTFRLLAAVLLAPTLLANYQVTAADGEATSKNRPVAAHSESEQRRHRKPINVLLITGGCCHDYHFQTAALTQAISNVVEVNWTIFHHGGTRRDYMAGYYNDPDWADHFDVVIHNACFAKVTDADYVRKITEAHRRGAPAVVIHCANHTHRDLSVDDWRKFLGITSLRHEHQSNYRVNRAVMDHPAIAGMPDSWTTPMDELYVIEKVWPGTTVLATTVSEKDGREHPVIWVNNYGGTRVFGTTFGHSEATFRDSVFLNLLVQGVIWAAGK